MQDVPGTVYLIHFAEPYRHAKHYLGWASDLEQRITRHRCSHGARLLQVVNQAGIEWKVVRVWEDETRHFERRLKNRKNSPRLCPVCGGEIAFSDVDEDMFFAEVQHAG
jgi:predicted GIY-YIG superfamily endonuclease